MLGITHLRQTNGCGPSSPSAHSRVLQAQTIRIQLESLSSSDRTSLLGTQTKQGFLATADHG